jgi:hypothetical protein
LIDTAHPTFLTFLAELRQEKARLISERNTRLFRKLIRLRFSNHQDTHISLFRTLSNRLAEGNTVMGFDHHRELVLHTLSPFFASWIAKDAPLLHGQSLSFCFALVRCSSTTTLHLSVI